MILSFITKLYLCLLKKMEKTYAELCSCCNFDQCKCYIPLQTPVDVAKDFLIQDHEKLEGVE